MSRNLYVRKDLLFVVLILMFYFLPLQSTSAAVLEYSISGNVYFFNQFDEGYLAEITGTALIDDEKTPYYSLEDLPFNCQPTPASNDCDVRFAFTYFDMDVGGEYNFTGTGGYIEYNVTDTYGALDGTGDWSMIYHSSEGGNGWQPGPVNYEEWLAFELPTTINFGAGHICCDGEIFVNNPMLLEQRHYFSVTLEQVVPVPAAVWLFGSGLIGLIGIARRKRS